MKNKLTLEQQARIAKAVTHENFQVFEGRVMVYRFMGGRCAHRANIEITSMWNPKENFEQKDALTRWIANQLANKKYQSNSWGIEAEIEDLQGLRDALASENIDEILLIANELVEG